MNRFRELRKERELSQQALAQLLGINQTTVSQLERGVTSPSAGPFSMLCEVLNTTSDYLLGITSERELPPWSSNSIMEVTDSNIETLCKSISYTATLLDTQNQKLTFDILIELFHVLKNKNIEQRVRLLKYLQVIFSASTHFADIGAASPDAENFENEQLNKTSTSPPPCLQIHKLIFSIQKLTNFLKNVRL